MDDISTSFCFICLLHLANERGLKLEVDDTVEEDEEDTPSIADKKVGNLWDLKVSIVLHFLRYLSPLMFMCQVYRDPAATPAS